jgi:hypothetical protein
MSEIEPRVVTITANTIMPHDLSPEDKDAREKGLQLVTHIEHLSQTDEGFQRWIQEGIDDIEAGRTVLFKVTQDLDINLAMLLGE